MAEKGIIFSAPMVQALLGGRKTQTRRILKPQPGDTLAAGKRVDHVGDYCTGAPQHGQAYYWRANGSWNSSERFHLPYASGDRLYVRESWRVSPDAAEGWHPEELRGWIDYQACGSEEMVAPSMEAAERAAFVKGENRDWDFVPSRYRPCIHMPRWTSRLWLAVTGVRVQRLQDCSEADPQAEGCVWDSADGHDVWYVPGAATSRNGVTAAECYSILWDTLHTAEGERWQDNPWVVAVSFDVHRGNIDAVAT